MTTDTQPTGSTVSELMENLLALYPAGQLESEIHRDHENACWRFRVIRADRRAEDGGPIHVGQVDHGYADAAVLAQEVNDWHLRFAFLLKGGKVKV